MFKFGIMLQDHKIYANNIKTKYIPLVQKPCCCNVTCLQMILYRQGFGLFDQEKMAKFFDIKVGKDDLKCFNVKLGLYTRTGHDEGLKTIDSQDAVNNFFKKNKIPLVAKAVRASKIRNLEKFLTENIKSNNDLWVEYKSHRIHEEKYIHDNVIEGIRKLNKSTRVILIDPAGRHKSRLTINLSALKEAISTKFARETGFLVISRKKKIF